MAVTYPFRPRSARLSLPQGEERAAHAMILRATPNGAEKLALICSINGCLSNRLSICCHMKSTGSATGAAKKVAAPVTVLRPLPFRMVFFVGNTGFLVQTETGGGAAAAEKHGYRITRLEK